MTPQSYAALKKEYEHLSKVERAEVVKTVSWAASNGDRSENGDYIYGKKRLREIDKRLRYLHQQLSQSRVIDPNTISIDKITFGAIVYATMENGEEKCFQLVGEDEVDPNVGKISLNSPIGKALLNKKLGDEVIIIRPKDQISIVIKKIIYGSSET